MRGSANYLSLDHRVDANNIVAVASKQRLAVCRPRERQTLRLLCILAKTWELGLELVHNRLALKVENLDARSSSRAEPVAVRGEHEGIHYVTSLKRVEVLAVREFPEHRDAVLATRGAQRTVRRNRNSVDVALVAVVVGHELAAVELPHLFC